MSLAIDMAYTVDEVATYLRISRSQAYTLVRRGEIGHQRIGRRGVRVWLSQLCEYINATRTERLPQDDAELFYYRIEELRHVSRSTI